MIRVYCKLPITSAVSSLPGKILTWKRVSSHLKFLVSHLHLMILISTSLYFPQTSPFITAQGLICYSVSSHGPALWPSLSQKHSLLETPRHPTSVPAYFPIILAASFAAPFPKNLPCFLLSPVLPQDICALNIMSSWILQGETENSREVTVFGCRVLGGFKYLHEWNWYFHKRSPGQTHCSTMWQYG